MESERELTLKGFAVILISAIISVTINLNIPVKIFLTGLGVSGPAGGMIFFGGIIFTLWITLAHLATDCRRYSGVFTAILIPAFCMLFSPWYGVVDPPWFGIYGLAAFLAEGVIIEMACRAGLGYARMAVGGGIANLACLLITWLAIGFHTGNWPSAGLLPFYLAAALASGAAGALIALIIVGRVKGNIQG
ncbi:MAG: hypothetical protein DRO52_05285 [Candidatus Hecatellales archaeon]|nr:MAG: hypothetical protein DRO52_05285 [Candidatus Hecatellales archaeon]